MTPRAVLLAAPDLMPGAANPRAMMAQVTRQNEILRQGFADAGIALDIKAWDASVDWRIYKAVLPLEVWDYQDRPAQLVETLRRIESAGVKVFNSASVCAWNLRKTYLRELAKKGAPVVPTRWPENPKASDIKAAFEAFGCDQVVLKRQVGAGARGQRRLARGDEMESGALLDRPGMIQPFLPAIQSEGEFSFLFIDGELSHALVKRPAAQDYRIQPQYGGLSETVSPAPADLAQATRMLAALDQVPLYARVDMVRGPDGALMLMEMELIEPYLFPENGPQVGVRLGAALARRLDAAR